MSCLGSLTLPLIGAPMFLVSGPELVIAQCRSGIVGAFPALNARPAAQLQDWLERITAALAPDTPYAVNLIVHPDNARLEEDLATCLRFRVPLILTSLSSPGTLVQAVHAYGGRVFHDVTTMRHAEKALSLGVDGLVLVCAGAGGHGGTLNPFAFLAEVRRFWGGPIALAGALTQGQQLRALEVMGADYGYMGTRFIATQEARASVEYKAALLAANAADIVNTDYFTGIRGNYLKASILQAGLDPDHLPPREGGASFAEKALGEQVKAWRDIWGAGQGVGTLQDIPTVETLIQRLKAEYNSALRLAK